MNPFSFFICIFLAISSYGVAAIEAVVFDFGGVIVHEMQPPLQVLAKRLQIPMEEALTYIKPLYEQLHTGKITERDFWTAIATHFQIQLPDTLQQELENWYLGTRPINEKTVSIVKKLQEKGYRTPLLSDTTPSHARLNYKYGRYDLFSPVILSFQAGVMKNSTEAFFHLLDVLDLEPEQCLFIDNRLENVIVSEEAGIQAIHFSNPDRLEEQLLEYGIAL